MLIAGFETTTNLITNAAYRLVEHRDQLERYLHDPAVDKTCIEEVLRFDPPTHFMRARTIVADTVIGGAELHPGDPVVPLLAAANRDPEEFPEPETFDVGRTVNRHLSFGVGHHRCIGSALARLEARVAVRRLFERFPALHLDPDEEPDYRPNLQLRGFAKLPVRLG
jgi:cytochrome P450